MTHRAELIRRHTAAVLRSARQYRNENHCRCGAWLPFAVTHREPRLCERCKRVEGAA